MILFSKLLLLHILFGLIVGLIAILNPNMKKRHAAMRKQPQFKHLHFVFTRRFMLATAMLMGFWFLFASLVTSVLVIVRRKGEWSIYHNFKTVPSSKVDSLKEAEAVAKYFQKMNGGRKNVQIAVDPIKRAVRIYKWSEIEGGTN